MARSPLFKARDKNWPGPFGWTTNQPRGIIVVAVLSIVFGLIEVGTAFTHSFAGISTTGGSSSTFWSGMVGSTYALAGVLLLTRRRWGANAAIAFFAADVAGRVGLVAAGLYPLNTTENLVAIVLGTLIAVVFAVYVGLKRNSLK